MDTLLQGLIVACLFSTVLAMNLAMLVLAVDVWREWRR